MIRSTVHIVFSCGQLTLLQATIDFVVVIVIDDVVVLVVLNIIVVALIVEADLSTFSCSSQAHEGYH